MIEFNIGEEMFESFFKSISERIAVCGEDGKIKFVNNALEELIGRDDGSLLNTDIHNFIDGWDDIISNISDKKSIENIEANIKSAKNILKLNLSVFVMHKAEIGAKLFIIVFKEIQKERKLEERLSSSKAIYTFDKIIGRNKKFLKIIDFAKKVSDSKSTVLITGQSGTGKEVFAQSIHNCSSRKEKPFIAVNCGAIPVNLIESELFGYEEGAFTGAKKGGNIGKFEMADDGTIFLDEIGEMPFEMQVKLLRVIEEGVITRVGSTRQIPINVRIIAATNKDLKREIRHHNFREDLFYRLNVIPIHIPPLRDRRDDIPLLVDYYMNKISKKLNKKKVKITEKQMDKLFQYNWPGNIRELENVIELFINIEHVDESVIELESLSKERKKDDDHTYQNEAYHDEDFMSNMNLENLEKRHIENVIRKFKGNVTLASKAMGIGRNTLYRKIKKYNIYCSTLEHDSKM